MTDRIIGALLISILTVLLEDIISKVKDEQKVFKGKIQIQVIQTFTPPVGT